MKRPSGETLIRWGFMIVGPLLLWLLGYFSDGGSIAALTSRAGLRRLTMPIALVAGILLFLDAQAIVQLLEREGRAAPRSNRYCWTAVGVAVVTCAFVTDPVFGYPSALERGWATAPMILFNLFDPVAWSYAVLAAGVVRILHVLSAPPA